MGWLSPSEEGSSYTSEGVGRRGNQQARTVRAVVQRVRCAHWISYAWGASRDGGRRDTHAARCHEVGSAVGTRVGGSYVNGDIASPPIKGGNGGGYGHG